jgi:Domain of unknown function (DUF4349)
MTATLRSLVAGAGLGAVVLLTAGCGSGSSGTTAGPAAAAGATGVKAASEGRDIADSVRLGDSTTTQERSVISTGRIELTSSDVATARSQVDDVLARVGGRLADESTTTDDRGTVDSTHLVVRVPSSRFDDAMRALAGVATLRSSDRKAEDVTTQVIDVNAKLAAQRAGVRRLRQLVSRTADLRALLAVERALTVRQGELESLRQQRAYLEDRTSLATITVDITRHTTPSPATRSTGGFVGGLRHGWHALVALVVGLLVGIGAALPFAVAGALVGLPVWLVVRRQRRPREPEAPAES